MNLDKILGEIEKIDPEVYDRLDTRRHAMQRFKRVGGKIALSAVPFAFGSMLNKAYSQAPTSSVIIDVLTYALTLEYLEAEFYSQGVTKAAQIGIAASDLAGIQKIADDESKHVLFLKSTINTLSPTTSTAKPNIDLSGGQSSAGTGPFASAFTNYDVFLAVAQTFEDTGVRAYKGRAGELARDRQGILTAALNIHSVEARHAAHIRGIRNSRGATTVKPWITLNQSGIPAPFAAAVQPSYDGATSESNTSQATINIVGINGQTAITSEAASEAFDEPLTKAEVLAIVGIFFY